MKINGMQVAPVEDDTTKKAKSRVKKNAQTAKRKKIFISAMAGLNILTM